MMKIETQGIRYCGAKTKLIPQILSLVPSDCKTILDAFSGTTRVSQGFKLSGYSVDCNDLAEYSKVFGEAYIANNESFDSFRIINTIELTARLIDDWFTKTYGGQPGVDVKKPFQSHNMRKLDGVLAEINRIRVSDIEKSLLLTSIILGLDKVDNTLGHHAAYLRNWSKRSYDTFRFQKVKTISGSGEYNVFQQDVATIKKDYCLTYIDPPYGTNRVTNMTSRVRYNSYYHIWNTICKNDQPALFGVNNRRADSSDKFPGALSVFESTDYDAVLNAIKQLCENLSTKYIIFSYSNKSKVTIKDLTEYFSSKFTLLNTLIIPHKENVQKILTGNKEYMGDIGENLEYLFLIKK